VIRSHQSSTNSEVSKTTTANNQNNDLSNQQLDKHRQEQVEKENEIKSIENNSNKPFSYQIKLPEGLSADQLQVRVHNQVLTVTGEKRVESNGFWSTTSFTKKIVIPSQVDADKISAFIHPGDVLELNAPVKEATKDFPDAKTSAVTQSPESSETKEASDDLQGTSTQSTQPDSKPSDASALPSSDQKSEKQAVKLSDPPKLTPFQLKVTQNDKTALVLTVKLPPGATSKNIDLQVEKGILSISGTQHQDWNGSVLTSKFVRHFVLDTKTSLLDQITATLDDAANVVTVTVPTRDVAADSQVKKIPIQVGGGSSVTDLDTATSAASYNTEGTTTVPSTAELDNDSKAFHLQDRGSVTDDTTVHIANKTSNNTSTPTEDVNVSTSSSLTDHGNNDDDSTWTNLETPTTTKTTDSDEEH